MAPFFKSFDYMKRFHCIGPDCEDTCCQGWKVNLFRKDYDKIKGLLDKDKALHKYKKCLTKNPIGERIDDNYGALDFSEDGHCGMMDEGWCILHRDHGESMLPTVCATFPRLIYEFKEGWEVHGRLSCPEVARLCLLSPEKPQLEDDSKETLPEIYETNPWARQGNDPYKKHLGLVSQTIRNILFLDHVPLPIKNYMILYLAKKLEPFFYLGIQKDPESRLQRTLKRMEDTRFQQQLVENYDALESAESEVMSLVLAIANARLGGTHFKRYNDMRALVMRSYDPEGSSSLGREGVLTQEVPLPSLWRAFLARKQLLEKAYGERISHYFTNFSINFWWQLLFVGDKDLMIPARKFLIYYSMIRFFYFSHPRLMELVSANTPLEEAQPVLDETIVEVVQIFMKNIDASYAMMQSFLTSMDALGFTNLNKMAALLK